MEFDHLKGFYHVARLGSFTEAATRLYLTQPAISLQIKALEKEVGERLFDRIGRTIRLTHAGGILYKQVEEILAKLDELELTIRELKSLERGCLSLGASDTMSIYFLPDLLTAFLKAHPRVELRITSVLSPLVLRKLLDREIDLGIITLSSLLPKPVEVVPLLEQRLICIVEPNHPFAARKLIDTEEIAAQPLILLEQGSVTRKCVDEHLAGCGCQCRPVVELSNFEIIKRYVATGLGVSLIPEGAVLAGDNVTPVAIRQNIAVRVGVIYRQDRRLSHPAGAFLDLARDFFTRVRPGSRLPMPAPPAQGLGAGSN